MRKVVINIQMIINGLHIHYLQKGQGKPVLILPGWGTTIDVYMAMINSIAEYRKVYCLDMPGFGKSEEPKIAWDLNNYMEFIIKFIESQQIKELDIIGHSNGGRISIKLLNQKNLRFKVNKLILIGSAGIVHKTSFTKRIRVKLFKIGKKIVQIKMIKKKYPDLLDKLKSKFGSEDYRNASPVMQQSLVKLIHEDLKEELPNIQVPTLLLWGTADTETPIEDAEFMEKVIPDAGLVKFENASHYVFLERMGQIHRIIKTFLQGGENK